jgi:type IV pilus biogenesis protein CpaD/CtpE
MTSFRPLFFAVGLLTLAACENPYASTLRPDYTIRVTPTAAGNVATAPTCPSWNDESVNPFDNQPLPQFGCATARNLADMIENPKDIVEGREMGKERGVTAVGAVRRYDNNQTRGLIMPSADSSKSAATTSPSSSSSIVGDVTGGGASPSIGSGVAASAP